MASSNAPKAQNKATTSKAPAKRKAPARKAPGQKGGSQKAPEGVAFPPKGRVSEKHSVVRAEFDEGARACAVGLIAPTLTGEARQYLESIPYRGTHYQGQRETGYVSTEHGAQRKRGAMVHRRNSTGAAGGYSVDPRVPGFEARVTYHAQGLAESLGWKYADEGTAQEYARGVLGAAGWRSCKVEVRDGEPVTVVSIDPPKPGKIIAPNAETQRAIAEFRKAHGLPPEDPTGFEVPEAARTQTGQSQRKLACAHGSAQGADPCFTGLPPREGQTTARKTVMQVNLGALVALGLNLESVQPDDVVEMDWLRCPVHGTNEWIIKGSGKRTDVKRDTRDLPRDEEREAEAAAALDMAEEGFAADGDAPEAS